MREFDCICVAIQSKIKEVICDRVGSAAKVPSFMRLMRENENVNGNWFLPGKEKVHFNGTLSYGPDIPVRLNLIATLQTKLSDFSFGGREYTIWGYDLDGKPITLLGCNRLTFGGTANIDKATFNAQYIIIGKHVSTSDAKDFTGVRFTFDNLNRWLAQTGYKIETQSWSEYQISYKRPNDIGFKISDSIQGAFTVWNNLPFAGQDKLELLERNFIELNSNENISLDEVLERVYRFQQLFSLLMFAPTSIRTIILLFAKHEIKLFYKQSIPIDEESNLFLIRYPLIKNVFEDVVLKWFDLSSSMEPIINILYANIGSGGEFAHNNFLNIVQAVEAYHRRRIQKTQQLKAAHKEAVSRILNQIIDEKDRSWLRDKLSFSYEPSLRVRLNELVLKMGSIVFTESPDSQDINKLIKLIVNKRNYYTHYDPSLEEEENVTSLLRLTHFLKLLLTYCILEEIGLNTNILADHVYKRFRVTIK